MDQPEEFTVKMEIKSSNSNELSTNKEMDESLLLEMLSLHEWYLLLTHLKEDQILEDLSNASLFYRDLLLSKRTKFLFSKVLAHVTETFAQEETTIMDSRFDRHQFIPAIQNCRLVCQKWNQTFERKWERECLTHVGVGSNFWLNASKTGDFVQHFKETHPVGYLKSPLLHHSLNIDLSLHNLSDVLALLKSYGDHVWNVKFTRKFDRVLQENLNDEHLCSTLCTWLESMPNLRSINFYSYAYYKRNPDLRSISRVLGNHLPDLNFLQSLELWHVPAALFNAMLAKYQRIVTLKIYKIEYQSAIDINNFLHLRLKTFEILYSEIKFAVFEKILTFGIGDQLESFALKIYDKYVPWSRVLLLLSKRWGATLESLTLDYLGSLAAGLEAESELKRELEPMHANNYKFEKLKFARIKMSNVIPLDFLYGSKDTLEKLVLRVDYRYPTEKRANFIADVFRMQRLDVLVNVFSLEKSNIWRDFPKLISVKYTLRINCRALWNGIKQLGTNHLGGDNWSDGDSKEFSLYKSSLYIRETVGNKTRFKIKDPIDLRDSDVKYVTLIE